MSPARRTRLSEEEQRKLMAEQAALTGLTKHPSWPTLLEIVMRKCERLERVAVARMFTPAGINAADAQYMRGMRDGMRYLVNVCNGAEDRLESFLKEQGVRTEGE